MAFSMSKGVKGEDTRNEEVI